MFVWSYMFYPSLERPLLVSWAKCHSQAKMRHHDTKRLVGLQRPPSAVPYRCTAKQIAPYIYIYPPYICIHVYKLSKYMYIYILMLYVSECYMQIHIYIYTHVYTCLVCICHIFISCLSQWHLWFSVQFNTFSYMCNTFLLHLCYISAVILSHVKQI